jgi:hypothetical protein
MVVDINNSKDAIRSRMLRHAFAFWDIKNAEDLDPIVKLILEALSVELYNLTSSIKDTQVRMLEKIAGLLSPDYLTSANPAHALLHAKSVEPEELLSKTTSFYTQRKVAARQNETSDTTLDVYFTPVDTVKIHDASIAAIKTGTQLFEVDASFTKQLKARSTNTDYSDNHTMWLGLKVNASLKNLKGVHFYFDTKNLQPAIADVFFQLLPVTKWHVAGREIKTQTGFEYIKDETANQKYDNRNLEYDPLAIIENDIKESYNKKYVLIAENVDIPDDDREAYPPSFKHFFKENDLQKLTEKLVWVKVVFPAAIGVEVIDETNVYLNTFPVVNRRLVSGNFRLKGGSNIVPLKMAGAEQFLAVKSLTDESHVYKSIHFRRMEEEEIGTYTLRKGGVERFDARNAKEIISYLLELTRSESGAFAAYGYDFIATTLKEMNQRMVLIEQKMQGSNSASQVPNYIIVKPFEGQDMMYVDFWTTLAEAANGIRSGTRMQQVSGAKVKADSLILLTTTLGGKNQLRPEERLAAFRYGMMTRNRIVTKEDIKNFCFYELGSRISDVTVQKGFEMSANPTQSFTRTIRVALTPNDKENLADAEWQILLAQLTAKLEARSGASNHYKIFLHATVA